MASKKSPKDKLQTIKQILAGNVTIESLGFKQLISVYKVADKYTVDGKEFSQQEYDEWIATQTNCTILVHHEQNENEPLLDDDPSQFQPITKHQTTSKSKRKRKAPEVIEQPPIAPKQTIVEFGSTLSDHYEYNQNIKYRLS